MAKLDRIRRACERQGLVFLGPDADTGYFLATQETAFGWKVDTFYCYDGEMHVYVHSTPRYWTAQAIANLPPVAELIHRAKWLVEMADPENEADAAALQVALSNMREALSAFESENKNDASTD